LKDRNRKKIAIKGMETKHEKKKERGWNCKK
jgi:hypothetical protein